MSFHYSDERNVQILVALLKAHHINKIIASPGTTNISFVASIMNDDFFEIYSSVDERSACYMACGMAAETGEPVVITCTGATASRNYYSGLTEAFYRKLPVIAITATQDVSNIGHLKAQVINRDHLPKDIVKCSVHLQAISNENDEWDCMIKVNTAILESQRHGKGPVHINLTTTYSRNFSVLELPPVNIINRIMPHSLFPELPKGKIAIFIGSHRRFNDSEITAIDSFCECNNGVVFCDPTSNYNGRYKMLYTLVTSQLATDTKFQRLLIHIGEVSEFTGQCFPQEVWRVSEDGEIRDRWRKLTHVFEMDIITFFNHYIDPEATKDTSYYEECRSNYEIIRGNIQELPFSNLWVAQQLSTKLPPKCILHLGILNSLRSWSYFYPDSSIEVYANEGGFGIDGCISSLIGASLVNQEKLFVGIVGDLAFFYDINSLGNRHVGKNIRLILINNGRGAEFHLKGNAGSMFGGDTQKYISAGGHFGQKSSKIVEKIAEEWGFGYKSAHNKTEFNEIITEFLYMKETNGPAILEIFTTVEDDIAAIETIGKTRFDTKSKIKNEIRDFIGEGLYRKILKK